MTVYEACEKIQAAKYEIDRIQNEDEMTERDDALLAILVDYVRMINNMQVVCKGV